MGIGRHGLLGLAGVVLLGRVWGMGTGVLAAGAALEPLRSPDGRIEVSIQLPEAGTEGRPRWGASFKRRPLLKDCRLGLRTVDDGELMAGARAVGEHRRSVEDRFPVLFGKSKEADARFHEVRLALESRSGCRVDVVFRCYNDAVAFRYELPANGTTIPVTLTDEGSAFEVVGDPRVFVQYLENYRTSHEHNVTSASWRGIRRGELLDMPLTVWWPEGVCLALTEASLRHYAGMALMRPGEAEAGDALVCRLTPRSDGTKVVRARPVLTPWRVVLIGDRWGTLLESETILALNEPCALADTSWIRPGKISFPWWNGDVYDGRPGLPILSVEMARRYLDFCASHGLAAHSLTSTEVTVTPWYHQTKPGVEPGPDTDVTRPREGFDLPAIRRYAESKGVRLWTWVHQGALRGRVEEAFAAFEQMGWSGLMVDFFDHDDQASVELAESILEAAARHHLLVHFHGVWKPTGWRRTYPHLMNHEGALNLEYLKWSDRCTPEHDLLMAFTRLIAGPMDYHLGGFRAVPREAFRPRNVAPHVLGTRGHMLAMYVCFDNPNPMVADYPTAYEGQPGFEFLQRVPTWWDETRVVTAKPGELLVTARRRGESWYLGGLSAGRSREVRVPLSFLGEARFRVTLWKDVPEEPEDPNRLSTETRNVSGSDTLHVRVADGGGFVAEFVQAH